jgi:hypothetical protein
MNSDVNNGPTGLSGADWDRVHEAVQAALRTLAEAARRRWPTVVSQGGRTSTTRLPLFSYWTFQPAEGLGLEPVVVGVDFQPAPDRIRVRGDIATEESGRILYDRDCCREVAPSAAAVIAVAREIATALAARTDVLAEALTPAKPASAT